MLKSQQTRWFYLLGWCCSLLLLLWAVSWEWAEWQGAFARQQMAQWDRQRRFPQQAIEWQQLRLQLQQAQQKQPYHAQRSLDLGRLALWQARQFAPWSEQARSFHQQSLHTFVQASQQRPSWGLAWANLSYNYSLVGQTQPNGLAALERAMLFTPFENGIEQQIAQLGLAHWELLDQDQRQQLKRILRHLIQFDPNLVIRNLVNFWLDFELGDLVQTEQQQALLERYQLQREQTL